MRVLLDTNILLDVLQERHPYHAAAARVWKLVEEKAIEGVVSAISFNNIFYIARKQSGRDKAMEAVRYVRRIFGITPLDAAVIDFALETNAPDFEDAIQVGSAKMVQADYVVTRNSADCVPTVTAEELLALLP
jgi:predicted nucleic acid-binding protein